MDKERNTGSWVLESISVNLLFFGDQILWFVLTMKPTTVVTPGKIVFLQYVRFDMNKLSFTQGSLFFIFFKWQFYLKHYKRGNGCILCICFLLQVMQSFGQMGRWGFDKQCHTYTWYQPDWKFLSSMQRCWVCRYYILKP